MFPAAILAGGLATRMRPITETIPKALIDIAGEPFIVRQLRYLRDQGLREVVLCVGYLGEQIREVVGDGRDLGVHVRYSFDGKSLLGTGGALKRALPLLGDRFFVIYGDSWMPVAFAPIQRAFEESGKRALMTVLENGDRWDKSNVSFSDGRLLEYNKRMPNAAMRHIDYGIGVLSASVFAECDGDVPFDIADTYHALSQSGDLAGFEVTERFYEIGSPQGLAETIAFFSEVESK